MFNVLVSLGLVVSLNVCLKCLLNVFYGFFLSSDSVKFRSFRLKWSVSNSLEEKDIYGFTQNERSPTKIIQKPQRVETMKRSKYRDMTDILIGNESCRRQSSRYLTS